MVLKILQPSSSREKKNRRIKNSRRKRNNGIRHTNGTKRRNWIKNQQRKTLIMKIWTWTTPKPYETLRTPSPFKVYFDPLEEIYDGLNMIEFEISNKGYVRHEFLPELKNAHNIVDIEKFGFQIHQAWKTYRHKHKHKHIEQFWKALKKWTYTNIETHWTLLKD